MFLIFAASILLLITTITAPVINSLSLLRVQLASPSGAANGLATGSGYTTISYGTFGYCLLGGSNGDFCTARHIGYKATDIASALEGTSFDSAATNVANGLTSAMVLHPIACGVAFLAFLVALGAGVIGSLAGFLIAAVAWALTLVVMAIDFTLFAVSPPCIHPIPQVLPRSRRIAERRGD